MKKAIKLTLTTLIIVLALGFTPIKEDEVFSIDRLYDYQKEYKTSDAGTCALGDVKTYMDYRAVTNTSSKQYWFIRENMTVDNNTGFLYDEDGFIGVALGSYYGEIGDRFYFTLDSGVILPVVKIDEKSDRDTDSTHCYHVLDTSVIEFVISTEHANEYFGYYGNGLVLQGNYSNYQEFKGSIVKVEKVLEEKVDNYVTYVDQPELIPNTSIFNYASGY